MSSDGFEFDQLDSTILAALDRVENVNRSPLKPISQSRLLTRHDSGSSLFDVSFNVADADLVVLDQAIDIEYTKPSVKTVQTTLFGSIATSVNPSTSKAAAVPSKKFGQQASKTKKWDHTEFAKTGAKGKSSLQRKQDKERREDGIIEVEDEPVEFEQFPAPVRTGERLLLIMF